MIPRLAQQVLPEQFVVFFLLFEVFVAFAVHDTQDELLLEVGPDLPRAQALDEIFSLVTLCAQRIDIHGAGRAEV